MVDLLVLPRPAESLQNGAGSEEKLEQTGPAKKERAASAPQCEKLANPPLPKRKRAKPLVQIMIWERVKVSKRHTLARMRGFREKA